MTGNKIETCECVLSFTLLAAWCNSLSEGKGVCVVKQVGEDWAQFWILLIELLVLNIALSWVSGFPEGHGLMHSLLK